MSALQQLANRVAATRLLQTRRLEAMASQNAALVEVIGVDAATGLTTVRDAAGGVRQVASLDLPVGAVTRLSDGLFLG